MAPSLFLREPGAAPLVGAREPPLQILLVEDDPEDAEFIAEVLEEGPASREWPLTWAPQAERALALLRERSFDAVLVDQNLGASSGTDLIQTLKASWPSLPVLLLTGSPDPEVDRAALRAGASGFAAKLDLAGADLERTLRYAVEQGRAHALLWARARTDPLTGLHNRASFEERCIEAIERQRRSGQGHLGLALLDLDGFKAVNDTCGHEAGDRVLAGVAHALTAAVRPYDTVARLGGDEFVALFEGLGGEDEAHGVAQRLVDAVAAATGGPQGHPPVTASVGVALCSGCGSSPEQLLATADAAMFRAKRRGKNQAEIAGSAAPGHTHPPRTPQELQDALRNHVLDLEFQPQVHLASRRLSSAEGLVRWHAPDGESFDAGRFVAELERNGAITLWDQWGLKRACQLAKEWAVDVSINLSAHTLGDPHFLATAPDVRNSPGSVTLELSERSLPSGPDPIQDTLHILRVMGYRIAVDDFGSGSSSLLRFATMPVDVIKLDRSLVETVDLYPRRQAITRSLVQLCKTEGLTLVAEGVETAAEAHTLRSLGVEFGQGFLYARAMPAEALERWAHLEEHATCP